MTKNQRILDEAIQAIQYGDRATGRRLLAEALHADPRNVRAWLWMSQVAEREKERRECLDRVLAIEPDNQAARARLAQFTARGTARAAPEHRRTRLWIILAGALTLSLIVGLALVLYVALAVVPRVQARAERLHVSPPQTGILWCPTCAQAGEPVLLHANLGAGLFGRPTGELAHGTAVTVLDYEWSPLERRTYVEVAAGSERGWVPEEMVRD